MDRWKAEQGRGREKRKIRREKSRRERVRRKKMQMREKVGKSPKHCVFPMICGSGGSKSRLAKAAGAEPAGQMRDEKLHAVVARSTFRSQVKMSDHFWKLKKSARRCGAKHISKSTCYTRGADHFWKLRCRKSARRCGAKHISKSKVLQNTPGLGPLLEVEMSKKCTPLWREAHFEVKMYKTHQGSRTTFGSWDVEKVHAVVARSTFRSQNVQNTTCSRPLLEVQMSLSRGRRKGLWTLSKVSKTWGFCSIFNYNHHYTTLHSNTLHYTTTTTTPSLHSTTLHSTTLHCTQLHSTLHNTTTTTTQLHSTTLHYTPLHSTTLNHTTLYYITLHYTPLHDTTLHDTTLHYIPLHFTTLHYTTLHYTKLDYTALHYTTLHSTTLHYITLHYTTFHYTSLHYTTLHSTTLQLTTTNTQLIDR